MDNDLVRVGDLGQMRPPGAELLAGPALTAIATRRARGLAQPVL
jgi:hypothetical protein